MGACGSKSKVLRSPGRGIVGTIPLKTDKNEKNKAGESLSYVAKKAEALKNSIALVLPFQLDKVKSAALTEDDVKRAAMALDFYQGFQLGLDELSEEGASFALRVIDSRDSENRSAAVAKSGEVASAALIVGPIYPKEIKAFGKNLTNKNILQINPLAARVGDFDQPNLVSLTPSIEVHTQAMAARVAKDCGPRDAVIIYKTSNSDGRQFLEGFPEALQQHAAPGIRIRQAENMEQLNEALVTGGKNLIVVGTTDKFQLRVLLSNLRNKKTQSSYVFRLYGHPLWNRIDFAGYPGFPDYSPVISTESHLDTTSSKVGTFKESYYWIYGVQPSNYAYKGYDAAHYFGSLLSEYGGEYAKQIDNKPFTGLFSSYRFKHDSVRGYVNNAVSYKIYKDTAFQPIN